MVGARAARERRWGFEAVVIYWRGPAPFVFARLPPEVAEALRRLGPSISYGWGCIAVSATIQGVAFRTSLIPREDTYLLPLKVAVRRKIAVEEGEMVAVEMGLAQR